MGRPVLSKTNSYVCEDKAFHIEMLRSEGGIPVVFAYGLFNIATKGKRIRCLKAADESAGSVDSSSMGITHPRVFWPALALLVLSLFMYYKHRPGPDEPGSAHRDFWWKPLAVLATVVIATSLGVSDEEGGPDSPSVAGDTQSPQAAQLFSDHANLRSESSLSADVVATLRGRNGEELVINSESVDGWYHVQIGEREGWLFGTFIIPAAGDYSIAVTQSGEPALLRFATGFEASVENPTNTKVLVVDQGASLWQVQHPDGGLFYVEPADFTIVSG